ncbi:hypothetical protein FOA52_008509 [Chlamydomonas sp. UWO 241]|nr:hypothetical protein FOA52_008509 [Chlamydomonas sp. UWO 241]
MTQDADGNGGPIGEGVNTYGSPLHEVYDFGRPPPGCWGATKWRLTVAGCGTEKIDYIPPRDSSARWWHGWQTCWGCWGKEQEEEAGGELFHHPFSLLQRRYVTALFTLMAALLFSDQNLLAPNLTPAAEFFGYDETQKDVYLGGYVSAAFFGVGAPAALVVGYLSDRFNRVHLLFVVALIGSIPQLFMTMVTEYWQFFLIRILTGVSVGGVFPLIYSLLGDLFPIQQRASVSAFITIATGAGVFCGQLLSAWIGPASGDWRLPFVVVNAITVPVAFAMVATTKEPPRGCCEETFQKSWATGDGVAYSERISWAKIRTLLKVPSNWCIILQGLPGSLPWGMVLVFLNDFLQIENGFSTGTATLIITVFGFGAAVGVVGGGILGQWLFNRRKEWNAWLSGITTWLSIGPAMFLVNVPLKPRLALTLVIGFLGGALATTSSPNIKAVLIGVNLPETRGVAFALQTMTDDMGKALGPLLVAAAISSLGRQSAFNIAVSMWAIAGALITGLVFCMRADELRVQQQLRALIADREADESSGEGGNVAAKGGGQQEGKANERSGNAVAEGVEEQGRGGSNSPTPSAAALPASPVPTTQGALHGSLRSSTSGSIGSFGGRSKRRVAPLE